MPTIRQAFVELFEGPAARPSAPEDLGTFAPLPAVDELPPPHPPATMPVPRIVRRWMRMQAEVWKQLAETLARRAAEEGLRTLMVVGQTRNAGATTISVALAVAMAEHTTCRVLLVDAHLGHSGIASLLNVSATGIGLERLLEAPAPLAAAIVPVPLLGFDVLPVRQRGVHNWSANSTKRWLEVLTEAKSAYDLVLIDGGALATTEHHVPTAGIQACLLVRPTGRVGETMLAQTWAREHHIAGLGIIENAGAA